MLAEAQARLLDSFRALSAQALQANNQMFLDLADTALAKRQMAIDELVRPLKESSDEGRFEDAGTRNGSRVRLFDAVLAIAVSRYRDNEPREGSTYSAYTRSMGRDATASGRRNGRHGRLLRFPRSADSVW